MSMKSRLESFLRETAEKTTVNNQYPVLTSSKTGLYLQSNYFNKQVASQDNKGYKIIRRGQFTYRAMSDTGEFFPNMLECTDVGIVSPAYPVFEISRPEVILSEYLKYYFKSSSFQQSIASFAQGSTRTSVKFAKMKTVSLDLPSIEQQKTVVKVLDKTKRIIDDREALLKGLDNLIKARFVEMFGSIKSNDKGWNTVQLKDIADVRGRVGWKGYKKEDLRESGPLVLGATHLTDSGELDLSAPVYLSREKYEESPEIVLQKNDLIFTQRGNTIGKVGLVAEDIGEATINPCVLILRPLNIHPVYFKTYFVMDETKDDMWMLNSGSAQPMITQKGIGEYQLMIPPIELQNQFAEFVKQVDKSKVVVQKALDEAQLLFDSLMQKYFG